MTRRTGARARAWMLAGAATLALGCSSDSNSPDDGGDGSGTGGGPVGTVKVGNIFFESGHNGTRNPARDTVAVGQTVTWTWTATGGTGHSVRSQTPGFTSSATLTGSGSTFSTAFDTPGTYLYDCAVHGSSMSGVVVVE